MHKIHVRLARRNSEFHSVSRIPWRRRGKGVYDKVLSLDEETGAYVRLLRFEPGAETSEILTHDFFEEVYILEGTLTDKGLGKTFPRGMFAFRNPGMVHGPYFSSDGCMTIEFRHFGLKKPKRD